MYLPNLAEPEWININCTERLLPHVICMDNTSVSSKFLAANWKLHTSCPSTHIKKNGECYIILWYKPEYYTKHTFHQRCSLHKSKAILERSHAQALNFLADATSSYISPTLFHDLQSDSLISYAYRKYGNIAKETKNTATEPSEGFHICVRQIVSPGKSNLFKCSTGPHIPLVCDGRHNCPEGDSDERNCTCHVSNIKPMCKHISEGKNKIVCGLLYYKSIDGLCKQYLVVQTTEVSFSKTKLWCDGDRIDANLWNDLVVDCANGSTADETELKALLTTGTISLCVDPQQLPCRQGHSKCYNISDICYFKLEVNKCLWPCRNGGHLEKCHAFECNSKFKYHTSYCIPWSYVCDGKVDCPNKEDEYMKAVCHQQSKCSEMFNCKNMRFTCIDLQNICDGYNDCIQGDDEMLCDLKLVDCPDSCSCLSFALVCKDSRLLKFGTDALPFVSVSLQNTEVPFLDCIFAFFTKSIIMRLQDNNLTNICSTNFPFNLRVFDVRHNRLKTIKRECLTSLAHLTYLRLDQNSIYFLECHSFSNLSQLLLLNLSRNPLASVPHQFAHNVSLVRFLFLDYVLSGNIPTDVLHGLKIEVLVTTDYSTCCMAPSDTICTTRVPWFASCKHVLPDYLFEVLFVSMSIVIFIVNKISIILYSQTKSLKRAFTFIVIVSNSNDILFSFYLAYISILHVVFKHKYEILSHSWRAGVQCFSTLIVFLWFTLQTPLLQMYLSLSKLCIVAWPLQTKFKRMSFVFSQTCIICSLSLWISAVISVVIKLEGNKVPTNLCLPLVDPTKSIIVIYAATWCVAVLHLVTIIVMIFLHSHLLQALFGSQKIIKTSISKEHSNTALICQLVLVTTTAMASWLPTSGVSVAGMLQKIYPVKLVVWATVAILPVHSILNPSILVVFCLRTWLQSRWNWEQPFLFDSSVKEVKRERNKGGTLTLFCKLTFQSWASHQDGNLSILQLDSVRLNEISNRNNKRVSVTCKRNTILTTIKKPCHGRISNLYLQTEPCKQQVLLCQRLYKLIPRRAISAQKSISTADVFLSGCQELWLYLTTVVIYCSPDPRVFFAPYCCANPPASSWDYRPDLEVSGACQRHKWRGLGADVDTLLLTQQHPGWLPRNSLCVETLASARFTSGAVACSSAQKCVCVRACVWIETLFSRWIFPVSLSRVECLSAMQPFSLVGMQHTTHPVWTKPAPHPKAPLAEVAVCWDTASLWSVSRDPVRKGHWMGLVEKEWTFLVARNRVKGDHTKELWDTR